MELRTVAADDWETWREIRLRALKDSPRAFGSTYAREIAFTEADWRDRLEDGTAVLVYDGDEPVSMGAGFEDRPGRTMVVAMWTRPESRGLGTGRLVLEAVVREAEARGRTAHLWVATSNPARGLYEGAGFRADGNTMDLHSGALAEHLVRQEPYS